MSRDSRIPGESGDSAIHDGVSRRKLLQVGTAGAAIGVAGCLGNEDDGAAPDDGEASDNDGDDGEASDNDSDDDEASDDDNNDDTADSGGEPLRDTLTIPSIRGDTLHDLNYNTLHPAAEVRYQHGFIWPGLANWSVPDSEWQPVAAAEWSFPEEIEDGSEATITLRDDLYWHNGDQVTAEDAAQDLTLRRLDDPSLFEFIGDWEADDETTLTLVFDRMFNRDLVVQEVLNPNLWDLRYGGPPYTEFHESLEEATSDEEREDVLVEITEHRIEEPVGFGPFKFEEAATDHVLYSRFDDYPIADFNFNHLRVEEAADVYRSATAEQQLDRAINQNFFYEDEVQYPEAEIREYVANKGFGICFDTRQTDLYFDNPRVRQAIAYAVDRYGIAMDLAPQVDNREEIAETLYLETVTGMNDNAVEEFLGDWTDNLPTYDGRESNFDRAAEILEDEGFYMENDWWHTPDDERWGFETINYGEWEWQAVPQSIVGQLRSFGIDIEQRTIESGEYWSNCCDMSEYEMRLSVWGGDSPQSPLHPALTYQSEASFLAPMSRVFQAQHDTDQFTWDEDLYYEAPMPVGDHDGTWEEVNITQLVLELNEASDPDRQEEIIRELAWTKSHYLNTIPVYAFLRNGLYNTEHWSWMEAGGPLDNLFNNQLYTDIPAGSVTAKTE